MKKLIIIFLFLILGMTVRSQVLITPGMTGLQLRTALNTNTTALYDSLVAHWSRILLLPSQIASAVSGKQATLVSGTNIKTVGGVSLLGSGDIAVGGTGTMTSVAVTTANGVSASIANPTTTANMTFSLGDIAPTKVNTIVLSGLSTPTLAVTGTSSITGSNTGDNATNTQYSGLVTNANHSGDVTGSGALTIANGAVTLAKMANMATGSLIYRKSALAGAPEVNSLATLKTDLGLTGTNSGDQSTITGNAGSATVLQTARNINGISFNGSTDITVPSNIAPGVNGNVMQSNGSIWTSGTPTGTGSVVLNTSPTLGGTPLAPTAVAGTNTTQIATTAFVDDVITSAEELGDYAFLKTDANTAGNATTLEYVQSLLGSGGGTTGKYYYLKGRIGVTDGLPNVGDSVITNTGFIGKYLEFFRPGIQEQNIDNTQTDGFWFNNTTGTLTCRPVFGDKEQIYIKASNTILYEALIPEGGGGEPPPTPSPLLDSLVAVWKLDEPTGNTANESVAGYNGTLYGATPGATGKIGLGVTFAATNSIVIPYNAALSPVGDRMTVSFWYKPSSLASTAGHALNLWTSYDATSHVTQNINVDNTNDFIYCDFMNTTGTEYLAHNVTPIVAGNWYHIEAICDGTGRPVKLYVNNVAFSGNTFSGSLHTTDDVTVIGNQNLGYSQNALGVIDNVKLWRQRHTKEDVAIEWNGGVGIGYPY
jgi:hypothetical protein